MSIPFRPPRKCTIVGDGMVTFGVPGRDRPKKIEVGGLNVLDVPQLARDGHPRRREVNLTGPRAELVAMPPDDGDALQPLQEVDVKERAAELAVGDALQPDRFLFPNRHHGWLRLRSRGAAPS